MQRDKTSGTCNVRKHHSMRNHWIRARPFRWGHRSLIPCTLRLGTYIFRYLVYQVPVPRQTLLQKSRSDPWTCFSVPGVANVRTWLIIRGKDSSYTSTCKYSIPARVTIVQALSTKTYFTLLANQPQRFGSIPQLNPAYQPPNDLHTAVQATIDQLSPELHSLLTSNMLPEERDRRIPWTRTFCATASRLPTTLPLTWHRATTAAPRLQSWNWLVPQLHSWQPAKHP